MEGIHGVDVSWLHHSQKDHTARKRSNSNRNGSTAPDFSASQNGVANGHSKPSTNGDGTPESHPHRMHSLLRSTSSEKLSSSPPSSLKDSNATSKPLPANPQPASRRNSWLSNISSKFSSSPPGSGMTNPSSQPNGRAPLGTQAIPMRSGGGRTAVSEVSKKDDLETNISTSPKAGHPSFLQNALRRLSSGTGGLSGLGRGLGGGTPSQRRVMNVNKSRDRCKVEGLDDGKLRRVAFCVDVEIAGVARSFDEDDAEKKKKCKKMTEKGEGEALKHPKPTEEKKDHDDVAVSNGENAPTSETPETIDEKLSSVISETELTQNGGTTRKKEKKKRSEEERKERKEKRRRQAEENGMIPVELTKDEGDSTPVTATSGTSTPRHRDRPTTDPVRIYRRCCQLRETPILKKITEQLLAPSACIAAEPGVVTCLDLSGYWLQLADLVTFGDYLAVVPVKKLVLENCGLTDEAVRVVLAGLLAARPNNTGHVHRHSHIALAGAKETHGAIEKLSLKNNPKIGPEGWRHISLFLNMSRSIKAVDLSMIPFPPSPPRASTASGSPERKPKSGNIDICQLFSRAVSERLAGSHLEELILTECNIATEQIGCIVDAITTSGLRRFGLANNNLSREGLEHIARYVKSAKCEGLDLGGNDLRNDIQLLADSLVGDNPLYALSLADCNLEPASLAILFPALVRLPNFRFIDLSHSRSLFTPRTNALGLLRRYLPQMEALKRIHLSDVGLTAEYTIALAEILPECPCLAHLNILENEPLSELSVADDEPSQEEACAVYASLMAAVRVSHSIICIDVDVPGPKASEVVKALAKQVVAYCLRNMERGPVAEAYGAAAASIADPHGGEKHVIVPDVLLHLVGHVEGFPDQPDDDEPAPDNDYVIGGTGVVKALSICLGNKFMDSRRQSRDSSRPPSGSSTPRLQACEVRNGKAKDMSKNLLGSARKIRERLQPALAREARNDDELNYRKLIFLDQTLERMIKRFEDEYPECRLNPPEPPDPVHFELSTSPPSSIDEASITAGDIAATEAIVSDDEEDERALRRSSRHNSDVSLASRAQIEEEGRVHRFGQKVRRDLLKPQQMDHAHGTTGNEEEAEHLQLLRAKLEGWTGDEVRRHVNEMGIEAFMQEMGANADELQRLQQTDPEAFLEFKKAQELMQRNAIVTSNGAKISPPSESAIVD